MNSIKIQSTNDYFNVLKASDFFDIKSSTDKVYRLNPKYGDGTIERIELSEGVELVFMEMSFHTDMLYEYEISSRFFEFAYCQEGTLTYGDFKDESFVTIKTGDIFYWINGSDKGWIKYHKNTKYSMVAIIYSDFFFDGLKEKSNEIKEIMFTNGEKSHTGFITSSELILNLNQIYYCRNDENSLHKYMYLYSKAFEMASIFLKESKHTKNTERSNLRLSKDDIDRINKAKEIVETNIVNPYSIEDLSKKVGLNSFKLKCGFKKMHQNTVFGHLRSCRMLKARECLECTDCTILEVANKVGYSNPSHFSVAFRKKYGIYPSELRNGAIKIPYRVENNSQ